MPTFCYSVFQSCYEAGTTFGFEIYSHVIESLIWLFFWSTNIGMCAFLPIVFAVYCTLITYGPDDECSEQEPIAGLGRDPRDLLGRKRR
jgi:hypothetical protein